MCGIAGILNFNAPATTRDELARMATVLAHRGPDGSGVYLDANTAACGLAHRRLAVIDLATGDQPMANEDRTLHLVYNGECYNFKSLRRDLQAAGHRFRTQSDTEVILHLYEQYGPDCPTHLRGMFAFALWDQTKQQLFLARDRIGQKPLYYAHAAGRLLFASEPKALLQADAFDARPDYHALAHYLLLGYVAPTQSAFADVHQLGPAQTLTINRRTVDSAQPVTYWSPPQEPTFTGTLDDAADAVRSTLADAVRLRMVSDVPLGAFLSGGIDSTIVVGLMTHAADHPVQTCSIGFAQRLYNELPYAAHAARRFHCDHHEHLVTPNCHTAIDQLSRFYDEPFADSSALPSWYLAHVARQHVTVALTGDGGDEAFGGYDRYRALRLTNTIQKHRTLHWLARRRLWQHLPTAEHHSTAHRLARLLAAIDRPADQRYLQWVALFQPDLLEQLLTESFIEQTAPADTLWQTFQPHFTSQPRHEPPASHLMRQAITLDTALYLPGDLNTKTDRAAMAIGLELRCPFQDHLLLELAASLPTAYRHNGRIGKRVLRHACSDLLTHHATNRPKQGFAVPVGQWFRADLRDLFCDTVLSDRALARQLFRPDALRRLLAQNDTRQHDQGQKLWALLMLELWFQRYIDHR